MATTIVTKNSTVAATPPSPGQLVQGELAVNVTDKKLYTLDGGGNVVLISSGSAYDVPVVISVNSATTALRITQTGAGNALLVEDSANPDATPFVITADGRIVSGATSLYPAPSNITFTDKLQLNGATTYDSSADFISWSTGTDTGTSLNLARSDSGTIGTHTLVGSADTFGNVRFFGSDGTNFIEGAKISAVADGTPGTNDMPGRLVFSTTADGASTVTERFRINSSGALGIAGANFGTVGQALVSAGSTSAPTWTTQYVSAGYVIDGGGLPINPGIKGDITIPFGCAIIEWTLLADVAGSIVVDIWKDTYANYPPTVLDTITGSALPTITAANKGQSSTLTGWTANIAAGDTLRFNVNSCATITRVT